MKNKKRSPAYIKLLHSIRSCEKISQMETIFRFLQVHCRNNKQDADLFVEYYNKEGEMSEQLTDVIPFEDENLNIQHARTCGAH